MKGFTLFEILIGISISSIIIVALVRLMGTSIPVYRSVFLQTLADETARVQLARMSHELRAAHASDTGAFPLVETSAQRLIFYANVDSDAAIERVRYELVGTDLLRGVTQPTGDPILYAVASEGVTTIARSIRNGVSPIFSYYTSDYPAVSTPAADISETTYISFSLTIDADTTTEPPAVTLQSQVQLRNLKSNL